MGREKTNFSLMSYGAEMMIITNKNRTAYWSDCRAYSYVVLLYRFYYDTKTIYFFCLFSDIYICIVIQVSTNYTGWYAGDAWMVLNTIWRVDMCIFGGYVAADDK